MDTGYDFRILLKIILKSYYLLPSNIMQISETYDERFQKTLPKNYFDTKSLNSLCRQI